MGGKSTREVHHYHDDKASKELVRKANEQVEAMRQNMLKQQEQTAADLRASEERFQEQIREASKLHAEQQAAWKQQLQEEQEKRRRESEEAQACLAKQAAEAEEHLVQELQKERENMQKAKYEAWQRLKRDYPIPSFLQEFVNEVTENPNADVSQNRFVNVAMLGDSGTGKSSLIRAMLKFFNVELPLDQMPTISMEGDGTIHPTRFPLAQLGQVSLWDLPGQGTSKIPSMTYLCNMGLKYFDAVCIVTDGRWSEGDTSLLSAIRFAGIRCLIARSKVDLAVDAGEEDKGWGQEETLQHVRRQLQRQTSLKPDRIHLVTSRERFWKDFGAVGDFCKHLEEEVQASLKGEAVEQMFEGCDDMDVDMDAAMTSPSTPDLDEIDFIRLDPDNNSYKVEGKVKRRAFA